MPPIFALLTLAITAGVLMLVLIWPRMRSGPSGPRLAAEAVVSHITTDYLRAWLE